MRFRNLVHSDEDFARYEEVLRHWSRFLGDWVDHLVEVFQVIEARAAPDQRLHHCTALLLTRHVMECIDSMAALTEKGSAQLTGPILRSAFEAHLGLEYVLESDSERRGLAYQVAYAHKRIKTYHKLDPECQAGKELRARLKTDPFACVLPAASGGLPARVVNLEKMFARPEFAPIEAEWQAVRRRKGSDPSWFSLFGGPADVQRLAERLGKPAMYEFLYRPWSDTVHAGNAFENMAGTASGRSVYRPLRHPDGLQVAVSHASNICMLTAHLLLENYADDEMPRFRAAFEDKLRGRHLEIASNRQLIHAPWK